MVLSCIDHTFTLCCGVISMFGLHWSTLLLQLFNMVIIANQSRRE